MKFYKSSFIRCTLTLVSLLVLFAPMHASAGYFKMTNYEEAIETENFKIRWSKERTGEIRGSQCMGCKTWRLKITDKTQAFENKVLTDIKSIDARKTPLVVILYDPKTNEVTRITW